MGECLVLAIAMAACSDATGASTSTLTAVVNHSAFSATSPPDHEVGALDTVAGLLYVSGFQVLSPKLYKAIAFTVHGFRGIGRYQTCAVGGANSVSGIYYTVDQDDSAFVPFYATDSACGGEVDIDTYLPAAMTISGTFHFVATSPSSTDTIHVTSGQFSGKFGIILINLGPP